MRSYRLYLFDFDNTLFDSSRSMEAMVSAGMEAVGLTYDHSMFPKFAGMTMGEIFDNLPSGGSGDRKAFTDAFETLSCSGSYRSAVPFPETGHVLMELKARGREVGIASGKMSYKIRDLLGINGFDRYVDAVVGFEDTELHKPDSDPIALVASMFDSTKDDILYIGDSRNDSLAARSFGVDVAIVRRDNGLCPDGIEATHTIGSLDEILEGWE